MLAIVVSLVVLGHPGGLDSNGGHYNRRTGEYHIHRPQPVASKPAPETEPIAPEPTHRRFGLGLGIEERPPRTAARVEGRTTPKVRSRETAPHHDATDDKDKPIVKYVVVMTNGKEKEIVAFKDLGEFYRLTWPAGGAGKYAKSMVQYIEEVETGDVVAGTKPE